MSEFIYLYRGLNTSALSPEEMQRTLEKWTAWFKELGEKGHLKTPGDPLEQGGRVIRGKQKTVTDGPYAEAKDVVGGYSVIMAKDITEALELSKSCPILEAEGSVEIRPIQLFGN